MTAKKPEPAKRGTRFEGPAVRCYLDTEQAGAYLGISPSTLRRMRVSGGGPRYSKVGRRVIYDVADLDRWVDERKRRFTGEATEGRGGGCGPEDVDE